jgi:hypothetical protein
MKYRADKPRTSTRKLREAAKKLKDGGIEKVPKMRRMRQKLKGRIEYNQ